MDTKLTYSQAISRLEELVAQVEDPSLPISQVLEKVKEATTLVNFCREELRRGEEQVNRILNNKSDGL